MALIRDPLNRNNNFRVNSYDSDYVVPNSVSQTREFRNQPKKTQLTQNSWNHSPYTRESNYNDIVLNPENSKVVSRLRKYRGVISPEKEQIKGRDFI